jgi:hypothetical protein
MRAIKSYVNFDYTDAIRSGNLSKHQKSKINKYAKAIENATHGAVHIYRPRRKDRLKTAKQYTDMDTLPGLTVAFIPKPDPASKLIIKFDKSGKLHLKSKYVNIDYVQFDPRKLATDAKAHVAEMIKQAPDANNFYIAAGVTDINHAYRRDHIGPAVEQYVNEYKDTESIHYFGLWLHGLKAVTFTNQADFDQYRKARDAQRKLIGDKKRNKDKQRKRAVRSKLKDELAEKNAKIKKLEAAMKVLKKDKTKK